MKMILAIAAGGALGATGRYIVGVQAVRLLGHGFPWGTFAVNILGSLAMGVLIEVMALRLNVTQEVRAFLVTGVLGGFTTFSTFSLDIATMIEHKAMAVALLYIVASVVLAVLALFVGLWATRALLT